MPELLAPAGDIEKAKFAFLYGADAVYFGGPEFGLRANAKNFTHDDIEEITKFAHSLNKKVYVTVNIIFHNDNLEGLDDYLIFLDKCQIDGVIVSDIYVIRRVNELKLNLFVVLSTQSSTLNIGAVRFWQKLGVKRIVMARESSRDNTKEIIEKTGIEIESFIHGAMCTSISGKCVLSNYLTNRDANRGGCIQPCRWTFEVDNCPDFTMMSKDLNMIQNIKDMIDIGISSFKIEGRMRSIYYIATVILCYRKIIDGISNKTLSKKDEKYYLNVLNRCANRDSAPQFYNKIPDTNDEYWNGRDEQTNQDFLGLVRDYSDGIATVEQRNYIKLGDEIQIFGPNTETFNYVVHNMYDENDNAIFIANHPRMIIKLPIKQEVRPNDILRIKMFDK
jgi:putative protease